MTGALIGAGICVQPCDGQGTLACKEPCVSGRPPSCVDSCCSPIALVPSAVPAPFFSEMEPNGGSQPILWRTEERPVSPHTCATPCLAQRKARVFFAILGTSLSAHSYYITGSSASTGPPAHKPEADVYQRTVRQYMTLAAEIKPRGRSQARIHSFNRYSQCQALASLMSLKQR